MSDLDDLMTPDELAQRWRTTKPLLANWRSKGRGPRYVKTGTSRNGRIFYPVSAVREFEAKMTRRPARNDDA